MSLATSPQYLFTPANRMVEVTEYTSKAVAKYRNYINLVIEDSISSIMDSETQLWSGNKNPTLSAARRTALRNGWFSEHRLSKLNHSKKACWMWRYNVDTGVFFRRTQEFLIKGRQKDQLLSRREQMEKKLKRELEDRGKIRKRTKKEFLARS